MKLATLFSRVCVAYALLFGAVQGNYLQEKWTFENGVVRNCEAMPDRGTLSGGYLSVLAPLLCTTPKVLEIIADTTIRSHAPIRTRDVVFHIHRGAHLHFIAPSVVLGRTDIRHSDSILSGEGSVSFQVDSTARDFLRASQTDEHGVVSLPHGSIPSNDFIRYTINTVIVSDPFAVGKDTNVQVPLPRDAQEALARFHARMNDNTSPAVSTSIPGGIPSDDTGPTAGTIMPGGVTNEDGSPSASISGASNGNDNPSLTTGSTSGVDSASVNTTESSSDGDDASEDASTTTFAISVNPTDMAGSTQHNFVGGRDNLQDDGNNEPFSGEPSDSYRNPWNNEIKQPPPGINGWVRQRPTKGNGWVRRGKTARRADSTVSVKVGEALVGVLTSPDGTASVSFSGEDGSLEFTKEMENTPRDSKGRKIDPVLQSTTTLIPTDSRKMQEVLKRREDLLAAEKDGENKGKIAAVLGFVPYGKHGYRRRKALQHTKDHLGEVKLTVDARGTVEGSMDGTVVLRRRAPSFFGFRRKDSSYELNADQDGLAVMRQGRRVWGIDAPDIWRHL